MDVAAWLKGLGLERYEAAFRDNEIDRQVLTSLTADDLKEIGIAAVGHRRSRRLSRRTPQSPSGDS
jgi:SAM domain (Sterile alpha motif)